VRITRLRLRELRRYGDATIDLAPGLTVVRGPNEAGKSTLQRAIELALTRKPTTTAADLAGLAPWGADPDARPTIGLEFTYEDEDGGLHQGTLEKHFNGAKGTVRLDVDGRTVTDPGEADTLLAELSGVPTEGFFRSTASVRHHELAGLQRDEAALRDRLQASISGADRGTSRAKKQLERALAGLRAGGTRNPGRLKTADDALTDASTRLRAGEDALGRLERDREALSLARERRADVDKALAERRSLLEKARQAERLTAEREAARERYERYRTAVVVRDELHELDGHHPSPQPLAVLRPAVERLRALDTRIATLEQMLAGEIQVEFEVRPERNWRPFSRLSLALALAGVLVAVVSVVLGALGVLPAGPAIPVAGAVAAGVGVVLGVVGWVIRRADRAQRTLRDTEVDRRLRGRSEIENELRVAETARTGELEALEVEVTAEAEERLRLEQAHVAEIDERRARLAGLVGDEPRDRLPDRRDQAALDIEQKTAALEALGPIAKEPRARERLEVEVREAEEQLERARDDEAGARARVEQDPVDAEEVAGLAERVASWTEQLADLRRRERVYAATLREIQAAEQATMQRATRYLERRMVKDIARVTDGRYRRVRVDDANLGIEVFSPEKADWVPVADLSQGTLDVVYLAARLGLVRLVTGDRRPPLILDDPFVTLDDRRAPRALELLREVAADFQVIYLTASDRYDTLADAVVVLGGPPATDTDEDGEETVPD
jgi:DNA repair exonuclease SbcCD ATPase subunit